MIHDIPHYRVELERQKLRKMKTDKVQNKIMKMSQICEDSHLLILLQGKKRKSPYEILWVITLDLILRQLDEGSETRKVLIILTDDELRTHSLKNGLGIPMFNPTEIGKVSLLFLNWCEEVNIPCTISWQNWIKVHFYLWFCCPKLFFGSKLTHLIVQHSGAASSFWYGHSICLWIDKRTSISDLEQSGKSSKKNRTLVGQIWIRFV